MLLWKIWTPNVTQWFLGWFCQYPYLEPKLSSWNIPPKKLDDPFYGRNGKCHSTIQREKHHVLSRKYRCKRPIGESVSFMVDIEKKRSAWKSSFSRWNPKSRHDSFGLKPTSHDVSFMEIIVFYIYFFTQYIRIRTYQWRNLLCL